MPSGVIIKGIGGFYYVKTEQGIYECKARGIFRKEDKTPLPGDFVSVSVIDEDTKKGSIESINPRKNEFIRPAVANITQFAAVVAVKSPQPDLFLLDKLLITAFLKDIEVIICLNKVDLDPEESYKGMQDIYSSAGFKVLPLSSKLNIGAEELRASLKDKVTALAGQSGVGKSTILNRILELDVMQTGEISSKIERGRHTTRHAELVELKSGGYIVDTPGFSNFELSDLSHEELQMYYPEFRDSLYKCRFTGCSHINEPGCLIKGLMDEGALDAGRYERYVYFHKLLKEISDNRYKNKKNQEKS